MKIQYIVSPTHPEYRNIPIRWDDQSISLLEYHLSKLNLDHVKYVYIDDIKNEDDLVNYYGVDIYYQNDRKDIMDEFYDLHDVLYVPLNVIYTGTLSFESSVPFIRRQSFAITNSSYHSNLSYKVDENDKIVQTIYDSRNTPHELHGDTGFKMIFDQGRDTVQVSYISAVVNTFTEVELGDNLIDYEEYLKPRKYSGVPINICTDPPIYNYPDDKYNHIYCYDKKYKNVPTYFNFRKDSKVGYLKLPIEYHTLDDYHIDTTIDNLVVGICKMYSTYKNLVITYHSDNDIKKLCLKEKSNESFYVYGLLSKVKISQVRAHGNINAKTTYLSQSSPEVYYLNYRYNSYYVDSPCYDLASIITEYLISRNCKLLSQSKQIKILKDSIDIALATYNYITSSNLLFEDIVNCLYIYTYVKYILTNDLVYKNYYDLIQFV